MNGLLVQLFTIFHSIVLPLVVLAGIGFLLQRTVRLDMATLTRLNFWFIIPGIIYTSIVTSRLTAGDLGLLAGYFLLMTAGLSALALLAARVFRVPRDRHYALVMSVIFDNAGNYGIPLQDLAFRGAGFSGPAMGMQVVLMVFQNISNFSLGIFLAAGGRQGAGWKASLLQILKVPPLYALLAGGLTLLVRAALGGWAGTAEELFRPFWQALEYVRQGFIPIAVLTLGAQLAQAPGRQEGSGVGLAVLLRLVAAPVLALGVLSLLGVRGLTAQVLFISAAMPTAVNALLLAANYGNHPGFVARVVFFSSVLSPLTVSLAVWLAQGNILALFGF